MRFSQRIGKTNIKTVLQVESIDNDLLNRLWNVLLENFFDKFNNSSQYNEETQKGQVCKLIWKEFFNNPIDKIPTYNGGDDTVYIPGFIKYVRDWFFKAEWFEIYDMIEYAVMVDSNVIHVGFTEECNYALKKEVSGYRIVNQKIVQITSEEEVQEIEDASLNTAKWKSVSTHLKTALDSLADRTNPNYRNSIKESISAVESFCKIITKDDNATLGKALTEIEKSHKIHGALKTAFSSIYGYTSDSGGIRHALLESDVKVEFEDAKFMLVSCSAFINYLKTKIKM
ncbi:MAG: hypothetical protein JNL69_13280 [Bacteroidia bacterium]|nr:hypothetical protein [Bacteroidia bacterium]